MGFKFILMETTALFLFCPQISTAYITLNYVRAYNLKDKTGTDWFGDKHPGSRSAGSGVERGQGGTPGTLWAWRDGVLWQGASSTSVLGQLCGLWEHLRSRSGMAASPHPPEPVHKQVSLAVPTPGVQRG